MAHFYNITLAEMTAFLAPQGFKVITLPNTYEVVFSKRVDQQDGVKKVQLSLRVYTGIEGENSREVGGDAIRVALFQRLEDGRIIKLGGEKRVHRVVGWKANLQNRLDKWVENMPTRVCPQCHGYMLKRKRKGTSDEFYGCANFPICKHTERLS